MAEQPRKRSKRGYAWCALAIICVVVIAFAAACSDKTGFSPTPTPQPSATTTTTSSSGASPTKAEPPSGSPDAEYVTELEQAARDLPLNLANGMKLGKDDAPLKLETFVDFQCPFCLKFTATQEPTLIKEYVKTGKLQIIVQPFPIFPGDESVAAAAAAECAADQDKFWPYYEHLYLVEAQAGQGSDEQTNVGRFSRDNLIKYAKDLKLDGTKFTGCLDSNTKLAAIQDSVRAAHNYGITATPGFVINGGNAHSGVPASMDVWRQLLDGLLKATPTAVAGSV